MSASSPKRKRVLKPGPIASRRLGQPATSELLRMLFNQAGIPERARRNELTIKIAEDRHPSPPLANEPICTRSQIIAYYNQDGVKVAAAHQYLRPDGTIGLSGKPDPKLMLHNGILYFLDGS